VSVRADLDLRLSGLPGLDRRLSRHGDSFSYFVAGREIAHFHGDERMDVRLTRGRIPELRAQGRLDSRVRTRGPTAEWIAVRVQDPRDVEYAVGLVEEAMRANA
jgi:hypothetical protein